jgi:transcriptional/translational regulatory protein YebC/TACO1
MDKVYISKLAERSKTDATILEQLPADVKQEVQNELDGVVITTTPTSTNEEIRLIREAQYKLRSDSLYMAWKKYEALGDSRATEAKQSWLDEVEKIEAEYPYNT